MWKGNLYDYVADGGSLSLSDIQRLGRYLIRVKLEKKVPDGWYPYLDQIEISTGILLHDIKVIPHVSCNYQCPRGGLDDRSFFSHYDPPEMRYLSQVDEESRYVWILGVALYCVYHGYDPSMSLHLPTTPPLDDFLAECFQVDSWLRASLYDLHEHPFIHCLYPLQSISFLDSAIEPSPTLTLPIL